ncbi:MAG: hypothetical protein K9J12_12455 [Melioribacteraceae bacterium]|nr:hypothetical protein [Melioribacteraceae bacterium]MCF8265839.1 hypothetical protein [Melioribacteraceae bacterium]MCF8414535.1 hypothetical protein [Melioribacteraceae bacterium]
MPSLGITDHVCARYIERFNPQLSASSKEEGFFRVRKVIKNIVDDAKYISDNEHGIKLISKKFKCVLIIKNKRLITIYPVDERKKRTNN